MTTLASPVSRAIPSALASSTEQLSALRRLFAAADYTEPALCRRTGIETIYDFLPIRLGRTTGITLNDALDVLIRMFLDEQSLERAAVERLLGADGMNLLDALGIVVADEGDPARCRAEFLLYPTRGLWIASDLESDPYDTGDRVFSAVNKSTRHYLFPLPDTPCNDFLEVCAGTGIAALIASRYARHTWATDITDRATAFARFNAALNEIENCTVEQGDLYDAVAGRTFDRIVCHPPYMPAFEQKHVYRDGGDDGEQITKRIIAGLPDYLRPGGRCYCTCLLADREGASVEDRIRAMIGPRHDMFDVLVITFHSFDPTRYYYKHAMDGHVDLQEIVRRHEIVQSLNVAALVYCSIVIERHVEPRPAYTERRQVGRNLGTEEIEALMAWKVASVAPDILPRLLDTPVVASPELHMRLDHTLKADRWVTKECALSTATPFLVEAKCPAWVAGLVAQCDGNRTTREHMDSLKSSGTLPPQFPEAEFAKMIWTLIDGGILGIGNGR
jgi:SAM-dependent methyltransferase